MQSTRIGMNHNLFPSRCQRLNGQYKISAPQHMHAGILDRIYAIWNCTARNSVVIFIWSDCGISVDMTSFLGTHPKISKDFFLKVFYPFFRVGTFRFKIWLPFWLNWPVWDQFSGHEGLSTADGMGVLYILLYMFFYIFFHQYFCSIYF